MYDDIYFFKNKYFIISTIISSCDAVFGTAIRTWWRSEAIFTITCNYIIYFVIITSCSFVGWTLWILKCKYDFFVPSRSFFFWGDIFWSFMELNKPFPINASHWVQLIFIRSLLFCTNCSWNEIKWTAFRGIFFRC